MSINPTELQISADAFRWYHEIDLGFGVKTKPERRYKESWDLIEAGMVGMDLQGKRVLDVGTRDGKYAFAAEKMGANVQAIDNDASAGAAWLKTHFQSKVDFSAVNLYTLSGFGSYHVIFLFGVLYHLRYPIKALRNLTKMLEPNGKIFIESGMMDAHHELPLIYCPVRDSPYEQSSCTFFNMEGLRETLWSFGCTVNAFKTCPSEQGKLVRRFWVEVEKTHEMPEKLQRYWEGIHTSHD